MRWRRASTVGEFGDLNLSKTLLQWSFFDTAKAKSWDFRGSEIRMRVGDAVVFDECIFGDTKMTVADLVGREIEPQETTLISFIEPIGADGCVINGMKLSEWVTKAGT